MPSQNKKWGAKSDVKGGAKSNVKSVCVCGGVLKSDALIMYVSERGWGINQMLNF